MSRRQAADHLVAWRASGVLAATERPAVYPYEFRFHHDGAERVLRGLIAAVDVEPFGRGIIPHERTLPGPLQDRLAVLRAVGANLSPIYAVMEGPCPTLAAYLEGVAARPPDLEAQDEVGTRHRLWIATEGSERVLAALRDEVLLIADGHHRYTVALAHREEMRAIHGPGPWDSMMMLVVDAGTEDPPVLPIHRLVKDRPTAPELAAWDRAEPVRDLTEVLASVDDERAIVGIVRPGSGTGEGTVHRIARLDGGAPAVRALSQTALRDVRPTRVRFVTDAVVAEEAIRSRRAQAAYILPPTRVERIRDVIRSGGRLPEKSTFFWPKPRTGMVIRPFDP